MGGQIARIVAGEEPLDLGPPPGARPGVHPLLERVVAHLTATMARLFVRGDPTESLALARLACGVPDDTPHADLFAVLRELFAAYEAALAPPAPGRLFPAANRLLVAAAIFAATPVAPLAKPAAY